MWQEEDRVGGAEFAEEGNGLRTLVGHIKQRTATGNRSGKAAGLNLRVLHQSGADHPAGTMKMTKRAGWHVASCNCPAIH